jgi:hypothetical protein
MAANPFFAELLRGNVRMPDAAINYGGKPLPAIPPGSSQFSTPDGRFNEHALPLSGLLPYAYGAAARISTQTQMAHPNRVQLIIAKLFLPSPQADVSNVNIPPLEHSISDGDLVFSFRMTSDMTAYGSQFFSAPYGYASKAVPLLNLATVNYILWGLQVGLRLPRSTQWMLFFAKLLHNHPILQDIENMSQEHVWNFIRTFLRPFAIQHGGDMQGGRHEGDQDTIVTHGAVDYVSSFAIEGKLLHVNNLWRDHDVHEGDDLVLSLSRMDAPHADLFFDLCSSARAHRTERVPVTGSWYYLRPDVLPYKSFSDAHYLHIGRSQKYCSLYSRGRDICCWNARMCVVPGAPLQMTFEPGFVQSDDMFYDELELSSAVSDTVSLDQDPHHSKGPTDEVQEMTERLLPTFFLPSSDRTPLKRRRPLASTSTLASDDPPKGAKGRGLSKTVAFVDS